ncbi:thiolase family protein [Nocardioides immobilis]|uniref:Probable acetyl-CoA acetyltransferase n=1 Tax=Nocardioides immobilis TaxID=2049295 RepID=A0A417Y6V3_9ACTN|nr:thiolase family protein [Nocardioides immobilis]RHW28472.1 thiolase family protein [Nocardioides immobilis]
MTTDDRIVILDGARTPIGSFGGALSGVPAHELGAAATVAALQRADVDAAEPSEVVMGCIGQVGPDAYNARRVALAAGMPEHVPAFTVNRLCGSGLQAVWSAAQQMRWNGLDLAVAGGDESMSRMPFYDFEARAGRRLGDRTLVDGTVSMLTDPFGGTHMGVTAENVAAKYAVSREEQDAFAVESQRRAATDAARSAFADEIVPVELGGRRPATVSVDEHPKPDTTIEVLAGLRPAFQAGGSVTAGNASGINDGAAALVLARESVARDRGRSGLVALEHVATAAMGPGLMGYAPVLALNSLFDRTGLRPSDIDIIELNEAFASQAVAVRRDAKLPEERTNPYGGAIALGHPVGATGAILTLRVVQHLRRGGGELGIVTMCIGGGQALAALFRRLD